jgi:hypothetical protein
MLALDLHPAFLSISQCSIVFHNIHIPQTQVSSPTPPTMDCLELLQLGIFIFKFTIVFILIVRPFQRLTRIIAIPFYWVLFLVRTHKFFFRENGFQYPDMALGSAHPIREPCKLEKKKKKKKSSTFIIFLPNFELEAIPIQTSEL